MKKNKNTDINTILKYIILSLISVIVGISGAFLIHSIFTSDSSVYKEQVQATSVPLPTYGTAAAPVYSPDSNKTEATAEPEPSEPAQPAYAQQPVQRSKKIIVLDPGHGKSSSAMSAEEKTRYGWVQNSSGAWGEWRHWKTGTVWHDCQGSGCSKRAPANGSCWYPIGGGDRATEPAINLNNALAAKKYLEAYGFEVRLTRTSDSENPSMTQRLEYCYPNRDTSQAPDADAFVCLHSNAGGGRGSCYITLSGTYDQAGISPSYINDGNTLGKRINDAIVSSTSLSAYGNGAYGGYPELVLFCKSPITIAYLEIGFFDNSSDLAILNSESDKIGKAIADGINAYFN